MIFKNSLKNIVRTPIKTSLFMLLLIAVTTFLCLGVGMWRSSDQLLAEADRTFTTTAVVEYIGENYPNQSNYGEYMTNELAEYDASPIYNSEYVISYDPQTLMGGYVDGLNSSNKGENHFADKGVLIFKVKYDVPASEDDGNTYYVGDEGSTFFYNYRSQPRHSAIILDSFYDGYDCYDGTFVEVILSEDVKKELAGSDWNFEMDHIYAANGRFFVGPKRALVFCVESVDLSAIPLDEGKWGEFVKVPLCDYTDYTKEEYRELFTYKMFEQLGEAYNVLCNYVSVYPTNDVEQFSEFQNGQISICDGRLFATQEYENGESVCIISRLAAMQLEIDIGDTITLSVYEQTDNAAIYQSYFPTSGFVHTGEYKVVGIYKEASDIQYNIYIPRPQNAAWVSQKSLDYTICRLRLKNGSVDAFKSEIEPYMLQNMSVTVFDQGYEDVAASLNTVKSTARILTVVCSICGFAVLMLFAYLYVSKQRNNVKTMLALGTGRRKTTAYLLISVMAIALVSVLIGGVIGYFAGDEVMNDAYTKAVAQRTADVRFSSSYANGEITEFTSKMSAEIIDPLISGGVVFAAAILLGIFFALNTINTDRAMKKGGKQKGEFALSPHNIAFVVKLAAKSIIRGKGKSLVVPIVSLAMIMLMCSFGASLTNYQNQLEDVYVNMPVSAYLSNYGGKIIDKLDVDEEMIRPIMESGFVKKANYTVSTRVEYVGTVERADGTKLNAPEEITLPISFAYATFYEETIPAMEKLTFTNNIDAVPAYFFDGGTDVKFISPYNKSIFEGEEKVCIMTQGFMDSRGIELGDTVRLEAFAQGENTEILCNTVDVKVVGVYPSYQGNDTVYLPIALAEQTAHNMVFNEYYVPFGKDEANRENWLSHSMGQHWMNHIVYSQRYNAVSFELQNTKELTVFKNMLTEMGYSSIENIGMTRTTMVIDDQNLQNTVNSLNRHISYMSVLYYAMYAISAGIGFVVSYLLTKTRKPEFAIMRSMGAGKTRTFFTFFIEQAILCIVGTLIGAGVTYLCYGVINTMQLNAILGYSAFYLVGIMLAIMIMNSVNVLKILSSKE